MELTMAKKLSSAVIGQQTIFLEYFGIGTDKGVLRDTYQEWVYLHESKFAQWDLWFSMHWDAWMGDNTRLLIRNTPAGQRCEDLLVEYLKVEHRKNKWQISAAEARALQTKLMAQIRPLWLEAHSQADLVLDMPQLSEPILEKAEAAAHYVAALHEARQELETDTNPQ
jgi:hypothetical protein